MITAPTPLAARTMVENGCRTVRSRCPTASRPGTTEAAAGEEIHIRTTWRCRCSAGGGETLNELIHALAHPPGEEHPRGDRGEGEQRDRLVALHERGVADRVHFLGFLTHEELRLAYLRADVFSPARHPQSCSPW
ncbi:hypothetical protein QJS66_06875 [Kocuria rhizophila]|nr:hypothetical protein QJS66_06875 [Kocuria rhizophila]